MGRNKRSRGIGSARRAEPRHGLPSARLNPPPPPPAGPWDRFFHLPDHSSNLKREITGGLTTCAAMTYVLAINPVILSKTGMDPAALVTATALTAALMTTMMALMTNYPIALAPGMGLNAFFTFTLSPETDFVDGSARLL